MKAINHACFKLEEKATRGVKKNKAILSMLEDKFTTSIGWGKLTISFCKKLFRLNDS